MGLPALVFIFSLSSLSEVWGCGRMMSLDAAAEFDTRGGVRGERDSCRTVETRDEFADGMMPFCRTPEFLGCAFVQTESQLGPLERMTVSVSVTALLLKYATLSSADSGGAAAATLSVGTSAGVRRERQRLCDIFRKQTDQDCS